MKKEKINKKGKRRSGTSDNNKLIELKITHVLPKYEKYKSEDVEIHDSPLLTVWKDGNSVNFWIGGAIAVLKLEHWEEVKKELRAMLFKDIKIEYNDDVDTDED